jgi:hypothetical protein
MLFLHISIVKVMVTSACKNYVAPNPSDPYLILYSDGGFHLPTPIVKGLMYAMGHQGFLPIFLQHLRLLAVALFLPIFSCSSCFW